MKPGLPVTIPSSPGFQHLPFKDEAQTALFEDPVSTAL